MLYLIVAVCLTIGSAIGDVYVPLKYNMPSGSDITTPLGTEVVMAHTSCDSLKKATIEVCASLPHNWAWREDGGFVYLNVFNSSATSNLSMAVNSTGKPGSGKVPIACVTILAWPGGDMYVRVDSSNYAPTSYVLSANVKASNKPYVVPRIRQQQTLPASPSIAVKDNPLVMRASAILQESVTLEYQQSEVLELDICNSQDIAPTSILTSIIAETGTLIHYVCRDLPCSPNSPHVICSSPSPMPIETCKAPLAAGQEKAYVYVSATGGSLSGNKFVTKFGFAASFE